MDAGTHRTLLTEVTAQDVSAEPFPHIAIPQALAADDYQMLARSFPTMEEILGRRESPGPNVAVRLTAKQVLKHPGVTPQWRHFFDLHTSPAFWREITKVFGGTIRSLHPDLERRVGRPLEGFIVGMRGEESRADVRLECQFVINTPGQHASSVKTAHIDKRQTLFAGLFYMRDELDEAEGGDLEFYEWKRSPRFLMYRMILPGDVAAVGRVPYAANTLVGFINHPRAVHGVTARLPSARPRRYINLIAELPFHIFQTRDAGVIARVRNWTQRKDIRRGNVGSQRY